MVTKRVKTKWELKRERLMQSDTYRHIINRIEGDAEMFHRINLAILVAKTHPGGKILPSTAFPLEENAWSR